MSTIYPSGIDNNVTLPQTIDLVTPVKAEVVNNLREAIIAIEAELGIDPSREFGTVRARLDYLQDQLLNCGSAITVSHNNTPIVTSLSVLDFIGSNVTVTDAGGGHATIEITGTAADISAEQETLPVTINGQTSFTLSLNPADSSTVMMFVNTLKQEFGTDYTVSGTSITYSGVSLLTTDVVEFWYLVSDTVVVVAEQETVPVTINGQTAFTLSLSPSDSSVVQMFVNGMKQDFGTDYTVSGTAVTYSGSLVLLTTDIVEFWYLLGAGASTPDLLQVLATGNTTGGLDIDFTGGSALISSDGDVTVNDNLVVNGDGTVNGDFTINGKLTVTGLIDPTGLVLTEQATKPVAGTATTGVIWVRTDNKLVFTDQTNADTVLGSGGGGSQTLAQTLTFGNTTGGTDLVVSTGDSLTVQDFAQFQIPFAGVGGILQGSDSLAYSDTPGSPSFGVGNLGDTEADVNINGDLAAVYFYAGDTTYRGEVAADSSGLKVDTNGCALDVLISSDTSHVTRVEGWRFPFGQAVATLPSTNAVGKLTNDGSGNLTWDNSGGGGGGGEDLAQTLAYGNTTDGYDIVVTTGSEITTASNDLYLTTRDNDGGSIYIQNGDATGGQIALRAQSDMQLYTMSGGFIYLYPGNNGTTGAGVIGNLADGSGGTQGGYYNINTGDGTSGNSWGGHVMYDLGNANGSGTGGYFHLEAGNGGTTGTGGYFTFRSGNGGSSAGSGGFANFILGNSPGTGVGNGGYFQVTAGNTFSSSFGQAGYINLSAGGFFGTGGGDGGYIALTSGAAVDGDGGDISFTAGDSNNAHGGNINITAGNSSNNEISGGDFGGNITLQAGNTTNMYGGNVVIRSGESDNINDLGGSGTITIETPDSPYLAGNINLYAGDASGSPSTLGLGGSIYAIAGHGFSTPGEINIVAGNATDPGTARAGAEIYIQSGVGSSGGLGGTGGKISLITGSSAGGGNSGEIELKTSGTGGSSGDIFIHTDSCGGIPGRLGLLTANGGGGAGAIYIATGTTTLGPVDVEGSINITTASAAVGGDMNLTTGGGAVAGNMYLTTGSGNVGGDIKLEAGPGNTAGRLMLNTSTGGSGYGVTYVGYNPSSPFPTDVSPLGSVNNIKAGGVQEFHPGVTGFVVYGSNDGSSSNGSTVTIYSGNAASAGSGSGGDIQLLAGEGVSSGAGGTINLYAGAHSVTGGGSGGQVNIRTAGNATSGRIQLYAGGNASTLPSTTQGISLLVRDATGSAGGIELLAGNSTTSGSGGTIQINPGNADSTNAGGGLFTTSGGNDTAGGATFNLNGAFSSGFGGGVYIAAGANTDGSGGGGGGTVQIQAGDAVTGAATGGGYISLTSGSTTDPAGQAGYIQIRTGSTPGATGSAVDLNQPSAGAGGTLSISSGSGTTGDGGTVQMLAGSSTIANGGPIAITAGTSFAAGLGGQVTIESGTGGAGDGDITLNPNTGNVIAGNYTFSGLSDAFLMPINDGADGYVLTTDGAGTLTFQPGGIGPGGTSPITTATTTTTNATQTTLAIISGAISNSAVFVDATITARSITNGNVGGYKISGVFENTGGTLTQVGSTIVAFEEEETSGWSVTFDTSGTNVRIRVTGEASNTIEWTAYYSKQGSSYTPTLTVGTRGSLLTSDGTDWVAGAGMYTGTDLTDADATINVSGGSRYMMQTAILSTTRTITLGTTGAIAGDMITIERYDITANTLVIANGGVGGGTIFTFPVSVARTASFQYDGTNWSSTGTWRLP